MLIREHTHVPVPFEVVRQLFGFIPAKKIDNLE